MFVPYTVCFNLADIGPICDCVYSYIFLAPLAIDTIVKSARHSGTGPRVSRPDTFLAHIHTADMWITDTSSIIKVHESNDSPEIGANYAAADTCDFTSAVEAADKGAARCQRI